MINLHCQGDWIYSHVGDTLQGVCEDVSRVLSKDRSAPNVDGTSLWTRVLYVIQGMSQAPMLISPSFLNVNAMCPCPCLAMAVPSCCAVLDKNCSNWRPNPSLSCFSQIFSHRNEKSNQHIIWFCFSTAGFLDSGKLNLDTKNNSLPSNFTLSVSIHPADVSTLPQAKGSLSLSPMNALICR